MIYNTIKCLPPDYKVFTGILILRKITYFLYESFKSIDK